MNEALNKLKKNETVDLIDLLELINLYKITHLYYTDKTKAFSLTSIYVNEFRFDEYEDKCEYVFLSDKDPFQALSLNAKDVISFNASYFGGWVIIDITLKDDISLDVRIPDVDTAEKDKVKSREISRYNFRDMIESAFHDTKAICDEVTISNPYEMTFHAKNLYIEFPEYYGTKFRIYNDSLELEYAAKKTVCVSHGKENNKNWMKFIIEVSAFVSITLTFSLDYDAYVSLFDSYKKCKYCENWIYWESVDKNGYCKSCIERFGLYPADETKEQTPIDSGVNETKENVKEETQNIFSDEYYDDEYDDDYENYSSLEEEYNYDEDAMQSDPRYWDRLY